MKNLIFILLLSISFNIYGQNLLLNPSFEDHYDCFFSEGAIDKCIFWHTANQSPDYFNICSWDTLGFSVPTNSWGYQIPKSGNAYASFGTYGRFIVYENAHEHVRGTLKNPLLIGQKYFVSFFVSPTVSPIITCATNNIGAWFTSVPYLYIFPDSVYPSPVNNQAQINHTVIINDTLNWTRIFGSFIADSAYTFIIIGNFIDDDLIDTLMLDTSQNYCQSMYYLDDVCVSTDSLYAYNYVYAGQSEKIIESTIDIFPNPANENLFIKTIVNSNVKITILNVLGEKLLVKNSYINEILQLNISNLEAGLYIIVIENNQEYKIVKFLKQ